MSEYGYSKLNSIGIKKKKTRNKKKSRKQGQKEMFLKIWADRPHISELSGESLGEEINVWFFAHILGKGAYPQIKLNPDNIMLVTHDEHWQLDQNTHLAKQDPLYKLFFDKAQRLKEEFA